MNRQFRFVSMVIVLVMVLGVFAAPMSAGNQVSAQKEVPTFVVAPTDIPVEEPVAEPTEPPAEEAPLDPGLEVTPVPTDLPEVVPLIEAAADVAVPGRFIVVFKEGVDLDAVKTSVFEKISSGGGQVSFEYDSAINGLTAEFSPDVLRKLRQDPRIEFIEMDQRVTIHQDEVPFSIQSEDNSPDSWGLDRIDQVSNVLDGKFYYPAFAGAGVNIYILDTGIRNTHENFNGRVSLDFDAFSGSTTYGYDCDGHGTHVAGTAAGVNTGIARKANIHSVRVLDCKGSGSTSQIIAGINWVAKNRIKPAVANMSLGGWKSPAEDLAVSNAISKGVTFVVAAGNDGEIGVVKGVDYGNACNYSPARVPGAITVGATNSSDNRASFSNYGSCVDIFAPGDEIYSSTMDTDTSYADWVDPEHPWSGTSMAAPHVTGVVALYLAGNPKATPAQVTAYILDKALDNFVIDPKGSHNRLLYLQNIIQGVPTLTSPLANAITTNNLSTFKWTPVVAADNYELHIYDKDRNSYFVSDPIENTQFTLTVPLPDETYWWAVSAQDATTSSKAYSQIRMFKVDTTGPAAPTLTFPAEEATVNGIPTFKWLASAGAKQYRLAYDNNNDPEDGIQYISNPTTYLYLKPASLQVGVYFYWYVQAKDNVGNWGEWSTPRRVKINPLKPAAPKLLTPANNFTTKNRLPDFSWGSIVYGTVYQIQIASNTTFTNIEATDEVAGLNYTVEPANILNAGKHYWRVRAKNNLDVYGPWTAYRTIIIDLTLPAAPALLKPASGGEVVAPPTFTWTVPVGAKKYSFEIAETSEFDSPVRRDNLLTPSFKVNWAIEPGTYYWHVRAVDVAGNEGAWSANRIVSILPAKPAMVTLDLPANNSFTDETTIDFAWSPVAYASRYELQIDNINTFVSPEYSDLMVLSSITTVDISGLLPGKYYWRVRPVNVNSVAGFWSVVRAFTISKTFETEFAFMDDINALTQYAGAPWNWEPGAGYIYNEGIADTLFSSTIAYPQALTDFSVQARLKMDPGTNGSTGGYYGLIVRGSPWYINAFYDWAKSYYFGISQKNDSPIGCFTVQRMTFSGSTMIGGFCDTAIKANDWNTMKVIAIGKNFKFYINDHLFWQGSDSTYPSGRVGVVNYSNMSIVCGDGCRYQGTPGKMYVDSFLIGAPVTGTVAGEELRQPDPSLGVAENPFEQKPGE